jgi:hypothetical protein
MTILKSDRNLLFSEDQKQIPRTAKQVETLKKHGFKPGNRANPKGRPTNVKRISDRELKDYLEEFLQMMTKVKMPNKSTETRTVFEGILASLCAKACTGDIRAIELILDRLFGRSEQKMIITHEAALQQMLASTDYLDNSAVSTIDV